MYIPIPPELRSLARAFSDAGFALYGVGGMVRNPLLGLPASDYDLCSAMEPGRLVKLCRALGAKAEERPGGLGCVELCFEGVRAEHTTFRRERYRAGHSPHSVEFTNNIAEDALRRDFSVNAIYINLLSGELADPAGGLGDLSGRLIRAATPDPADIMGHDPERVLRMCRFAAELDFDICPATLAAARPTAPQLLELSPQRIRRELDRLLLADAAYGLGGLYRGLEALDACGALDVLMPELAAGRHIPQRRDYHKYNVMEHMLRACAATPPVLELRLAGLFHDLGKPVSYNSSGRMYGHEVYGAPLAEHVMTRLGYPQYLRRRVSELVRHHMYDLKGEAGENTLRIFFAARGRETSRLLPELRRADVHGSGIITGSVATADRWQELLDSMERESAPFSESELAVTGRDIILELGLDPGPVVGEIKRKLLYHCARRPQDNTKQRLLKIARDYCRG